MAITDKQAIMVVHQEGMSTSTSAPQTTSACSLFVVLKELQPGSGMQEEGHMLVNREASFAEKSTAGTGVALSLPLSAMAAANTSNHLPAETTCKGITVTLDNNNMWNEFYRCQTEMILTKQGRRMFPYCRFRISGLEPFQSYTLAMDMHPADNYRYKWCDRRWETNGKADPHIIRSFIHPESPSTGFDWMQNPISFYKLKLTNNPMDQEGHIIINSMHRYLPRLHIIPADKATDVVQLNGPDVITFSFPQTEFFAVTAYQNLSITQLKIDYNPFAKGFRDDANSPRAGKPKNGLSTEAVDGEPKLSREATTLNNLKTLFAKRNAAGKVLKGETNSVSTNGDIKKVNGDTLLTTESEKSSSKKRQWPGGLSELIKGAHVKVKRMSLEDFQHKSTFYLPPGETLDATYKDPKPESVSGSEVEKERKPKKQTANADFVSESEGCITANTVSSVKVSESFIAKHETEKSPETINVESSLASESVSGVSGKEKVDTTLKETTGLPDDLGNSKKSQSMVKPSDSGEVKKKRAEPVPLPLLAHFLQQLKSKTRAKAKPEVFSVSSPSDKSSDTTSVTESSLPSTSSTPSNTSSNAQPPSSVIPERISAFRDASSSSLPTTLSSTLLTSSLVALPDTSVPLSPSSSSPLVQVPDPALISKHNSALTPDSVCDTVSDSTADATPLSKPQDVPVTSPSFSNSAVPTSCLSGSTLDTNVSTVLPSGAPDDAPCSADAQDNNHVHSEVTTTTTESTPNPIMDSSTPPCPDLLPENLPQSPLSDDGMNMMFSPSHTPSSPDCSMPSPATSSPDPFPPDLFSNRPIPPRKTLDPFSPYVSFDELKPPSDIPHAVSKCLFSTRQTFTGDSESAVANINCTVASPVLDSQPCSPKATNQCLQESAIKKSKVKHRKSGKSKLNEDQEVTEGPIPIPMQPSLEDVEGQLFVSFVSKKALEVHLGDEEVSQETEKNVENEVSYSIEERIDELEKVLLRDLKMMKHRQVIHPVLQEVGLKLNLLDLTLAIDLQYLGVCLPIPPPVVLPGESSSSSQGVLFVSRTGKTTDFTKIKGWREKFVSSNSSTNSAVNTTADSGQKNLSAFCSDMLDEYLENEGKLIDERAANLSQTSVSPVVYQLPTKSTSYVRTLDSVLKKQISPTIESPIKSFPPSKKSAATSKRKQVSKSGENALKKSSKSAKMSSSLKMPPATSNNEAPKVGETLSKKSKSGKIKTKKCSKTSEAAPLATGRLAVSSSSGPTGTQGSASISPGSNTTALRSPGLPKTLVKLMDVEDGAVWEGKHRTCITEERATIALCALFTTEGALRAVPSTIIKRRAPPCLNDFCRLGCVCASLAQERRQHHCGKPQCMLGCNCLRRKVVLLKKSAEYEDRNEGPEADVCSSENESSVKRSKKKKMAYIISGPEAAPEPATHVKTLWDRQASDPECLFTPNPSRPNCAPLLYPDLQQDLENFLHPSPKRVKHGASSGAMKEKPSKMTCARVRPFSRRKHVEQSDVMEHHVSSHDSFQEMEEGELRPPTLSGPFKRLEIVSKCTWDTEGSRNVVLRVVCERMAQDRLKNPFWIGKYRIEPTSRTVHETEEGTTITYKVVISQSHVVDTKKEEDERLKHLEAQLIKTIGKSEVKGLPLLSKVASAGFLKAEKKPPGAQGQITVNGKPYPQAKLELGWMGALHPANRLAAYITGRICPSDQQATKPVTSSTSIAKTSSTVSTTAITSWATTTTTTTTTVTKTNPNVTISVKPTVTKPPVGTGFTPVVINHVDSQQQKLGMTSVPRLQGTIKNIIHSTSSLTGATGVLLSPKTPPKSSMASTDGCIKVVKTLPKSGSTLSENPAKMLTVPGPRAAPPGVGASLIQPGASVRPAGPGQKMVFQVLKTTKGNTLYRNPNGQIIQLVPLSHFKALNPKFVISKQTTLVRLPSPSPPSPSKPQNSSHSIVICPSSLAKSTTKAHITSAHSAPAVSVTTAVTSSVVNSAASLSGFKPFLTSSQPSAVKVIPGFPSDSCTTNLTTIPQAAVDPRNAITTSVSLNSAPSDVTSPNKDLVLPPPQSCVPTRSQDKSDSTAHFSSASDAGSQQDEQSLQFLNENSDTTVPLDHSYTSESKTKCKEHNDGIESANVPEHMEEVLDLGPIETDEELSEMDAVLDVEEGAVEVEIDSDCTELTEDSDMYDDSKSEHSDQEDLCIDADSDDGEKKKTREISTTKRQDLCEKDDEVVDIESYEERSGKSTASQELKQQESTYQTPIDTDESEEEEDLIRYKKNTMEKERRSSLKAQFHKLHLALENDKHRMSNLKLLIQAQKEIQLLITQSDQLMKTEDKLRKKRAFFLQLASQLTGKTEESISQKLDEIITKQKALEAQIKAKNPPSHFTQPDSGTKSKENSPKPINLKKVDDSATSPVPLSPNSKPIDLSVPKRKILAVQHKEMCNVPRPKQPAPTLNMKAPPVSHTTQKLGSYSPTSLASRERTRPNILSRSKSQSLPESSAAEQVLLPQVIPVLEAVLPCNQIFTLRNSLQGRGITSLVERQSVTPGVASVSISVPAVSHPMRVENPITILQPQDLNVSTPVTTVSIPKISSVVSLVPAEKLLVPPPMVLQKVDSPAVVQTQLTSNPLAGKTQQNPSPDQKVLNKPLSEVMCKQLQQGAQGNVTDGTSNQNQEGTGVASNSEQDDENLMSLLDELVFLNQQLTNESSQPQEGDLNLINSENVPSDLLTENKEGVDKDDERSLSPLFLRLDEDLIASTTSKDDLDDIPPKLDDLVNVIFGSDSPPNSSESEVVAAADSDITRALPCDVVRDAPSPPPLMQMKTGGGDTAQPSKEQATMSWRPMPKLAPLGLKTQEAGQPKGTSPQALKPSSKLPSFHSANI